MQSLSTCTIITAPLGLSGCHGSPRSNIITSSFMSPPTRIQNASNYRTNFQKTISTSNNNNPTTLTLNSSRVVHSLISVLQLASNNIIPSSSATNSNTITKNANVEFAKLDLLTSSSLQQSTSKSLLSEMLKKQVEQRMNKNKLSPMQRKPIMIPPTRRIKNTENIHTNNQGHNRVITVVDAKTKSLKFGNCPLVVRAQKDDFSVGNDTSVTDSEIGESSQDNTRQDNIVAVTNSIVVTRKTSFVTSASIIRAKNDDMNNITNVKSLKSTKLLSPPPMKKGNRKHDNLYSDEVEDSDDDGYMEDDEYEDGEEEDDDEEEEEEEDDDDDDDEEEEEEEEGGDNENEEYSTDINYGDHLSALINSPASYRRTTSNYSTALSALTPKPNMVSDNNNGHDNDSRHGTLGNATSHPMMPRKTKSFPPYNVSSNGTKVKMDSHSINWNMNMKKGIPIPQPSMSNLNTDYNKHQHYRRKKHRYAKVGKNPEDMNDNREREGLREARNGEEGMFWPMSI